MSRLSDLYKAIETLRKEGISNSELEEQVSELEENIIKKEILPIITETIAPALKQVQRELILVVDYKPNSQISVHISRKRNFKAIIKDAKEILPDPQTEYHINQKHSNFNSKNPRKGLYIEYPDGEVLQLDKAADTLTEFIRRAGYQRVRELGITIDRINLVSDIKDFKYGASQHKVAPGWYVNTHSNGETKVKQIRRISEALNLNVSVKLIQ